MCIFELLCCILYIDKNIHLKKKKKVQKSKLLFLLHVNY